MGFKLNAHQNKACLIRSLLEHFLASEHLIKWLGLNIFCS
jgi:hypothetical protein